MSAISNTIPPTQPAQAETTAERTARHMAMCRDLAETAMQLVRQTAAKILDPQPEPAPRQHPQGPDTVQLFIRLANLIHKTIALESRIAAGSSPRNTRSAHSSRSAQATRSVQSTGSAHATGTPATESFDPRRKNLTIALDHTTENLPDRAAKCREIYALRDQKLAEHPEAEIGELFTTICNDLDIEVDYGQMPDEILKILLPANFVRPTSFELPEGWQQHAYPHLHPARR